jgi:hypothetical protein
MGVFEGIPEACRDDDDFRLQRRDPGRIRGIATAVVPSLEEAVGEGARVAEVQQVPLLETRSTVDTMLASGRANGRAGQRTLKVAVPLVQVSPRSNPWGSSPVEGR